MSIKEKFDIHEYECVSLDRKNGVLTITIGSKQITSPKLLGYEINVIATFIDLANDQESTGFASKKYMAELLGVGERSFATYLRNVRRKLQDMVLAPYDVKADSLFLSSTLVGHIPSGMEAKPYYFNTALACALKDEQPLDNIRTCPQQKIYKDSYPKKFSEQIEPKDP